MSLAALTAGLLVKVAGAVVLAAASGSPVPAAAHSGPLPALQMARPTEPGPGPAIVANIDIDGTRPGPAFQGIGAISGGGGNSRLLIDYPEPERTQILNYLFTPHVGAALQMLKLEIGGGGFSSDGSEPSVEPAPGQLACGSGYEFWLARQAVARNPAIKLYGLQWSAPSWVRAQDGSLWSTADVGYVVDWLRCAQQNGLTISYIGGWNEHFAGTPIQLAWFVQLRRALDLAGFTGTQIVAADQAPLTRPGPGRELRYTPQPVWSAIAADMAEDPAFAQAVSVLGVHDTCGLPVTAFQCVMAAGARTMATRTGRPLWESELGATPSTGTNTGRPGPGALARALNNAYPQAGVTGVLVWPLIDAIPPDLQHENQGLIWADHPWDGSYYVTPLTWVIAQTTQFTAVGWRYVEGADGSLPEGSFDTYQAPDRSAWTLVTQTSLATAPQLVTVHLTGGLPTRLVHVWSTNLRGPGQFVRGADITPHGGLFTAVLQPGFVYTFTTTTGPAQAAAPTAEAAPTAPTAGPMPLPYTATPDAAGMASMLSPMEGSFGYVNGVLTQTTVGQPVEWQYVGPSPAPYAVVGSDTWSDYTVSAQVQLPRSAAPTGAALIARFQGFHRSTISRFHAYEFQVSSDGSWQLIANGPAPATLASGRVAAMDTYALSLSTRGHTISAAINGAQVASVTSDAYSGGLAGLASLGYYPVRYLSFGVSAGVS